MGTRHKVKVIKNEQVIINQYGQWDGYPTTAGMELVNFLKKKENIDFLKAININEKFDYKEKSLQDEFIFHEMTITPQKAIEDIHDFIFHSEGDYFDEETMENVDRIYQLPFKQQINILYNNFGYDLTAYYVMITRDTGYKILDAVKELINLELDKKIPVFISDYDGFDIEAEYVIDLDKNTFIMKWHDYQKEYDIENLPNEKELEKFENFVYDKEENIGNMENLDKKDLVNVIASYNNYISVFYDEHEDGMQPVSIYEFYDNEYQEIIKNNINNNKYKVILENEFERLLNKYELKKEFLDEELDNFLIKYEDGTYTAIDNRFGNLYTEDFLTLEEAINWFQNDGMEEETDDNEL